MAFNKDLSSYLTAYGTYTIGVKAHAEGFRDSNTATTTYTNLPILTYVDDTELTFSNVKLGVSQFQLYIDNTLVDTIVHDPTSTNDVSIDITTYNLDNNDAHDFYIVVTAPDKNGTSATFESLSIKNATIYGVSGMYDSSATLTRTDDAVGMTYVKDTTTGSVVSDFDNVFPFSEMQKVTVDGNVFVKIPAMWWRIGYNNNIITDIAVSKYKATNDFLYKTEEFYYGSYLGSTTNSKLSSISNGSFFNSTAVNYRNLATANGVGYSLMDLYHFTVIKFLMYIEFGTKDIYSVFPFTHRSNRSSCGGTDNLTTPTGFLSNYRFRYRYIEDMDGNAYQLTDGFFKSGNFYYATADSSKYSNRTTSNFNTLSYSPTSQGDSSFYKGLGWDPNNPFLCLPTGDTGASKTTYFCCMTNIDTAVQCVGGSWYVYSPVYGIGTFRNCGDSSNEVETRLIYCPND